MNSGIFGIFSRGAAPAAPATAAAPAAAPAGAPVAGVAPAGTATATPAAPAAPANPLQDFAGMWGKLAEQQTAASKAAESSSITLDPKQLAAAVSGQQFAPQVTAEQAAALGIPAEGAPALQQLLNANAQTVFTQAMVAASHMMNQALSKQQTALMGQLPDAVRNAQFNDQLQQVMPQVSNPALQPLVDVVRAGISANNPGMTPSQLAAETQKFFSGLSTVTTAAPAAAASTETNSGSNILDYLGLQRQGG